MDVLRVYDPAECDECGVPLNWEKCRCAGFARLPVTASGKQVGSVVAVDCGICDGHGSLKAAALYRKAAIHGYGYRCEDCGHPMSEGTWSEQVDEGWDPLGVATAEILAGRPPETVVPVHYSPCDEGCRHGGSVQIGRDRPHEDGGWGPVWTIENPPSGWAGVTCAADVIKGLVPEKAGVRAWWRPVDVRTLGWPHDLRPEKLAVLCLRCWAARAAAARNAPA